MYDEVPGISTPLPRWFEIAAGETLFNIIPEPTDFEDMINREFQDSEVIAVGPSDNGGDEEGVVPEVITIGLYYY